MTRQMNILVDIVIEDPRWETVPLQDMAERALRQVLRHLQLAGDAHEVCLLACDDTRIAELNGTFRDKPRPTNVLSWPSVDLAPETPGATPDLRNLPPELGDIALAWDTCAREAATLGISLHDHLCHLIVHGVLHLLGYDHIRDQDATLMEALEVAILAEIGIADPYGMETAPQPNNGM